MRKQHGLKNRTSVVLGWVRDNTNWIATVGAFLLALGVSAAKAAVYLGVGIAIVGVLALLPICIKFFTRQIIQRLPNRKVVILLGNFEGPDPQNYRVTETILSNLRRATETYSDIEIRALERSITEHEGREVARREGEIYGAAIVLWGWYGKTQDTVLMSVNFEILKLPEYLPELGKDVKGQVQTAAIAKLESFNLQTRLSQAMSYLILFTLGLSRYELGDWNGTILRLTDALKQAQELMPTFWQAAVYFYRANSYSFQQSYDNAIADYTQALALQPDFAEAYNNRGNTYNGKGDIDRAFADFDQALSFQPNFAETYNNRGNAYSRKGDIDRAIADYTQALRLQPNSASAYYSRGVSYKEKGDYERAIADYTQALKLQPEVAEIYFGRGLAYNQKGDHDCAIADFTQALKLKHDLLADTYISRGLAYNQKGILDRAIADYTQALKLQPEVAETYLCRGLAYNQKGNHDCAIADFSQALKLKPDLALAYNGRGSAYDMKGSLDHAIADYTQVLKLEPDDAEACYRRGIAYHNKQDYDKAIADYTQALKLKPDSTNFYLLRGMIYSQQGERQKAIDDLKAALKGLDDPKLKQWAEEELKKLK